MTSDRKFDGAAQRRAELAASRAYEDDVVRSGRGRGEAFPDVFQRRISRRGFLKAGAAAAAIVLAPSAVSGQAATPGRLRGPRPSPGIKFRPLEPQPATATSVKVAEGYDHGVLLAWGDPVVPDAPDWDPLNQSAESQNLQFGYNCDYIGWHVIPMGSGQGDRVYSGSIMSTRTKSSCLRTMIRTIQHGMK
jgi:secreted PhoX family phosphatase